MFLDIPRAPGMGESKPKTCVRYIQGGRYFFDETRGARTIECEIVQAYAILQKQFFFLLMAKSP